MQISFFLPMKPPTVTHQEKKATICADNRIRFYEPPELKAARSKLVAHLGRHAPDRPMRGPLQLLVKWCFPLAGKHRDGEYKTSRPDTDNLQKLLKDCMTTVGYWKDDAQVASEIAEKFWAELPGIYIRVTELEVTDDS